MYERILVAVDGSPTSNLGLDEAVKLAKLTGARLNLIHVVDELGILLNVGSGVGYSANLFDLLREGGTKILEAAKAHAEAQAISPEVTLRDNFEGRVSDVVIAEARKWRADLIVLGTHGRRGVGRFLLGSDAEQILRSAPVLLVRVDHGGASKAPTAEYSAPTLQRLDRGAVMKIEARDETFETIYRRRAVRAFKPDKLDKATILELLNAAVQAPTAMHLEPWAFAIVQDRERLHRYSDRAKATLLGQGDDSHALVRAGDPHPHGHLAMLRDPAFNIFYNAGTLVVICRKTGGAFADADCWLAAENLMLAATARGLGTCCIGFAVPVLNMADTKLELGIPAEGAAVVPLIVGVPSAAPAPVPRKAPEILHWS